MAIYNEPGGVQISDGSLKPMQLEQSGGLNGGGDPAQGGLNLSNLLGGLFSAGGVGVSAFNQQQAYNGLQNALKTIGPTSLNGYNLAGPGGMSSGYNQNGGASIGLGSLDPAFGNFSGAAGQGSGAYSPQLLQGLTGNAAGTLGMSTGALTGAYGNYGQGMNAANAQLGNLGNFNNSYGNLLNAFRAQSAPGIQQQAYGLQNTLFGNGVGDSTGATSGSLMAQNFGRGVGQADANNQLNAFQGALSQQNSAASNYGQLTNSANGILSNAFNNFGNTNQLISGLNTAQLNNSLQAVQGAGALNTLGLNNFNAALQTGMGQATARNQSLFPYASVASNLAGTQNAGNILGQALSQAGGSLGGPNGAGGAGGFLNAILGKAGSQGVNSLLSSLFGGGGVTGASAMGAAAPALADIGSTVGATAAGDSAGIAAGNAGWLSGLGDSGLGSTIGTASNDAYLSSLASDVGGFSSAGGGAADAAGMTASELGSTSNAAVDAYAASAAGDAAGAGAGDAAATGLGSGASSGGLGSAAAAALPFAAGAVALAAPIYGATQAPYSLTGKYWNNMSSSLQGGKSNPQFYGAALQALNMPQNQVPANIQKLVYDSGFLKPGAPWGMAPGGTSAQLSTILQGATGKGGGTRLSGRV